MLSVGGSSWAGHFVPCPDKSERVLAGLLLVGRAGDVCSRKQLGQVGLACWFTAGARWLKAWMPVLWRLLREPRWRVKLLQARALNLKHLQERNKLRHAINDKPPGWAASAWLSFCLHLGKSAATGRGSAAEYAALGFSLAPRCRIASVARVTNVTCPSHIASITVRRYSLVLENCRSRNAH